MSKRTSTPSRRLSMLPMATMTYMKCKTMTATITITKTHSFVHEDKEPDSTLKYFSLHQTSMNRCVAAPSPLDSRNTPKTMVNHPSSIPSRDRLLTPFNSLTNSARYPDKPVAEFLKLNTCCFSRILSQTTDILQKLNPTDILSPTQRYNSEALDPSLHEVNTKQQRMISIGE